LRYLIANRQAAPHLPEGSRLVANGEMISFEQPWTFGPVLIARLDDEAPLNDWTVRARGSRFNAFAVEGIAESGNGQAYVLGGHIMRNAERFKPYAAAVPEVVQSFGGRFLARAGAVTLIAGDFVPERVVLIEFPSVDDALGFYVSERYAPLLKIRLETTEARLVLLPRTGDLPARIRDAAADYLHRHR
jgi:uncharacterized protein (DUF1330 family)